MWRKGVHVYPTSVRGLGWDEPLLAALAAAPTLKEGRALMAELTDRLTSLTAS